MSVIETGCKPSLFSSLIAISAQRRARPLERVARTLTMKHTAAMPRSFPRDLRERLLRARLAGVPAAEIERTTGVSARSIRRWAQRVAAGQSLAPGSPPGGTRRIGPADEDALRAQVAAHPDATLAEHRDRWATATGTVPVSLATMCRALGRLGLPLKKRA